MSNLKDAWIEIKNHVVRNKERYIVGAVVVTGVVITVVIMKKNQNLLGGFGSVLRCGAEGLGGDVGNTTRSSVEKSLSCLADTASALPSGPRDHFSYFSPTTIVSNSTGVSVFHTPVVTSHGGGKGHSGFVTRCLETGELFKTQGLAAEAFGIGANIMSQHLNHGLELDQGLHFERVGVLS